MATANGVDSLSKGMCRGICHDLIDRYSAFQRCLNVMIDDSIVFPHFPHHCPTATYCPKYLHSRYEVKRYFRRRGLHRVPKIKAGGADGHFRTTRTLEPLLVNSFLAKIITMTTTYLRYKLPPTTLRLLV